MTVFGESAIILFIFLLKSQQLLNRQYGGSVDETPEQDARVHEFQIKNSMLGITDLPETDDVLVCREIIKDIKNHFFNVIIPFSYLIEWNDQGNRRNYPMFEDFVRGFAVLRYRQRKIKNTILFADMADYEDAQQLYNTKTANQRTKLSDNELNVIKFIASETQARGETTINEMMDATGLSYSGINKMINGRKDTDTGLLFKVKDLKVDNRTEPVNPGNPDNHTTTRKNYYSLSNFDETKLYAKV